MTYWLTIAFNTFMGIIVNMTIITMINILMENLVNLDPLISNLLNFIFFSLIITVIVEPEKIKPLTIFATIILLVIVASMLGDNVVRLVENKKKREFTFWNFSNVGLFLGVANYAFESIGSLINSKF